MVGSTEGRNSPEGQISSMHLSSLEFKSSVLPVLEVL